MVQWDRRGVGKTRARSGAADPAQNTFAQHTDDAIEVVEVGYRMTLDRVEKAGNAKAARALKAIGDDPARWDLRAWQVKMNWTMKTDPVTPNGVTKLLFPLAMTSPLYYLNDVKHLLGGFLTTQKQMHDEVMRYDAYADGTRFEVPFFLLQGASDVLTVTDLAVEFFEPVDAPVKAVALIEDASHFAAFTQPERFLKQLLAHVRPTVTAA